VPDGLDRGKQSAYRERSQLRPSGALVAHAVGPTLCDAARSSHGADRRGLRGDDASEPAREAPFALQADAKFSALQGFDPIVNSKMLGATLEKRIIDFDKLEGKIPYGRNQKRFRLAPGVIADVQVDSFASATVVDKTLKGKGGDTSDQLRVGHPSFLESQGLDRKSNYFLTAVASLDNRLVTVKITRELSVAERDKAQGKKAEKVIDGFYTAHLDQVTAIMKKQVDYMKRDVR
jgi:hypothetical protein